MVHDETVSYIAMPKQAYTDKTAAKLKAAAIEVKNEQKFKQMWQANLEKHTNMSQAMQLVDGVVSVNVIP